MLYDVMLFISTDVGARTIDRGFGRLFQIAEAVKVTLDLWTNLALQYASVNLV